MFNMQVHKTLDMLEFILENTGVVLTLGSGGL